jgi:hypothetical protein
MSLFPSGTYYAVRLGADKNPAKGEVIASGPGDLVHGIPPEVAALWRPGEVAICWASEERIRHLSEKSLAQLRRTRLHNRLQRQVPLFAGELEERELSARPDFFAGKKP